MNSRRLCLTAVLSLALPWAVPASADFSTMGSTVDNIPAVMKSSAGRAYQGTMQLVYEFGYGAVRFPTSPDGPLRGNFALVPAPMWPVTATLNWHEQFPAPMLNPHKDGDWPEYGRLYLFSGKRLVIRCHIGAERSYSAEVPIKVHFVGSAVCADRRGRKYNIQFPPQ